MSKLIDFVLGFFVGCISGITTICMVIAGKKSDKKLEEMNEESEK